MRPAVDSAVTAHPRRDRSPGSPTRASGAPRHHCEVECSVLGRRTLTRSARLTTRSLAPSWGSPRDLIARFVDRASCGSTGKVWFSQRHPASCGPTGKVWFPQRHPASCGSTATPSLTASSRLGSRIGCARDAAQSVHSKVNVECLRATIIAANAVPPWRRLPLLLLLPGGAAKVVMQQVRRNVAHRPARTHRGRSSFRFRAPPARLARGLDGRTDCAETTGAEAPFRHLVLTTTAWLLRASRDTPALLARLV